MPKRFKAKADEKPEFSKRVGGVSPLKGESILDTVKRLRRQGASQASVISVLPFWLASKINKIPTQKWARQGYRAIKKALKQSKPSKTKGGYTRTAVK